MSERDEEVMTADEGCAFLDKHLDADSALLEWHPKSVVAVGRLIAEVSRRIVEREKANECSIGMGDGGGDLFVHGPYEAIKRVRNLIFAGGREKAKMHDSGWTFGPGGCVMPETPRPTPEECPCRKAPTIPCCQPVMSNDCCICHEYSVHHRVACLICGKQPPKECCAWCGSSESGVRRMCQSSFHRHLQQPPKPQRTDAQKIEAVARECERWGHGTSAVEVMARIDLLVRGQGD